MTLDEMIVDIRREINEPVAVGHLSDLEITAYVNRAQDLMASKITEADQNFFEESDQSLGFILNQEEYDFPARINDRKITRVTRTDLAQPKQLMRIRFQEKDRYHSISVFLSGSDIQGDVYYLRGNKIGIKPTPLQTIAANILIHYIDLPKELHWADVGSPTGTTFIIPTATTGAAPIMRGGRVSTTPNYYIGSKIRILTGTDRGLERTITAFDVATRTATINTAWTSANVSNQQYVILTPIPVEYHDGLYQYALMKSCKKKGDRERFSLAKDEFDRIWNSLINTIEPRSFDENQHVRPPVDQHFD